VDALAVNLGTFVIANGRLFSTVGSFSNAGTFVVGPGSTLKVNGALANSGTIDVSGAMIADYASGAQSPLPQIAAQIAQARHGGSWDQPGITSSAARSANPFATTLGLLEGSDYRALNGGTATFGGFAVDDSSVLVKYTYYGDTDLNGKVNFDDYVRTDNGFNNQLTGWLNGDFDLNDQVNFDDYVLIDLAFNTQSGTLGRALSFLDGRNRSSEGMSGAALRRVQQHFAQFGGDYASHFLAAVPEPTAVALAGMAFALLSRRRGTPARDLVAAGACGEEYQVRPS
jgi:hypothetical protein